MLHPWDWSARRQLANREPLVATWVTAYGDRLRPKLPQRWIQMRATTKQEGWQRLADVLAANHVRWALTGADAAERATHYLRAEYTEIYAAPEIFGDRDLLRRLGAQPAERRGNVLVITPPAPVALEAAFIEDDLPLAPPLLVYAELRYRGDAQALEAAEILLPRVMNQ